MRGGGGNFILLKSSKTSTDSETMFFRSVLLSSSVSGFCLLPVFKLYIS